MGSELVSKSHVAGSAYTQPFYHFLEEEHTTHVRVQFFEPLVSSHHSYKADTRSPTESPE